MLHLVVGFAIGLMSGWLFVCGWGICCAD